MKQLILVFIGGGLGSVLRFVFSKFLNPINNGIPYGTFLVNILGSLLIGFILGYAAKHQSLTSNQSLLLATGFCGGFTTFSTFAHENFMILKTGDFALFSIYSISSFVISLLAVFLGLYLAKIF